MAKALQVDYPRKAAELREVADEELDRLLQSAREKLYHLRYKMHVEELENPNVKSVLRRNIARIMTIQREREGSAS